MPMLGQMWATMAPTGKVVIAILGLLSVYSLAVVVERLVALRWTARHSAAFAETVIDVAGAESLRDRARDPSFDTYASLAYVVRQGLQEFDRARGEGADGDAVMEMVTEAIGHGLDVVVVNLRARLTTLATVAGVAPFLGLLGTVTGLIAAFRGIADTGGGGLAAVSSGVSEALVTTVFGLFVAMPALWAYNYLTNRIEVMSLHMDSDARRLLEGVVRRQVRLHGRPGGGRGFERRTAVGATKLSALPDITPIVNVALVLLIIFMIVTPMIREGVPVATPSAESVTQLEESSQAVVLAIQSDGSLWVNLKQVDRTSLPGELALAYRGNEGMPVVIKGAENLPYSDILAVMDVCKGVGAPAVDLVAARVE